MDLRSIVYLLILFNQLDCIYLPPSLEDISPKVKLQQTLESDYIQMETEATDEQFEIAEKMAERVYTKHVDTTLPTNTKNSSAFKIDTQTMKTLEVLLEHAMRHVAVLIPHPAIKTAYEKFIDFFPPGTIGDSITIIGKEVL